MAASNVKQFFVHLIGDDNADKASFVENFKRIIMAKSSHIAAWSNDPVSEDVPGDAPKKYPSKALNILYSKTNNLILATSNLIVFDIDGRAIMDDSYKLNPSHYTFCNGFIMFFNHDDPDIDNFNAMFNQFTNKLKELGIWENIHTKISVPLAVVITKIDTFDDDDYAQRSISENTKALKDRLSRSGHINAIRSIDSHFENVEFFLVSHQSYREPDSATSVMAPMKWVTKAGDKAIMRLM